MVGPRQVVCVLVALGALALPAEALACSCAATTAQEAKARSDAAVTARLVRVIQRERWRDYVYRVRRVFKGENRLRRGQRLVAIGSQASRGGADTCAAPANTGRLYTVFLDRRGGRWGTSLCGVRGRGFLSACGSQS